MSPPGARAILDAVLDARVEPVIVTDAEGTVTFVNTAAIHVFGADADVGQPVARHVARFPARTPTGRALPAELHPLARAVAERQAVIGAELTLDLEDGPAVYVVNSVPLRSRGRVVGTLSLFHDRTAAARLERDAAEHAARLETVVNLVTEAVFVVGADGGLVFSNEVGHRLLGPALGATPVERARRLHLRELDGTPMA
ncbi:MAG TPA: PAS domain-containing protein, partial [Methylomirabilota bacterium]|nr:PAS domain-containing protein [Methylomirabilota bacterium]